MVGKESRRVRRGNETFESEGSTIQVRTKVKFYVKQNMAGRDRISAQGIR